MFCWATGDLGVSYMPKRKIQIQAILIDCSKIFAKLFVEQLVIWEFHIYDQEKNSNSSNSVWLLKTRGERKIPASIGIRGLDIHQNTSRSCKGREVIIQLELHLGLQTHWDIRILSKNVEMWSSYNWSYIWVCRLTEILEYHQKNINAIFHGGMFLKWLI